MDRLAIHEAAHAVVWMTLGRPIEYAELTPGRTGPDERDGAVQPVPGTALDLESEILAALAGWSAELIWFGDDDVARINAEINSGSASDEGTAETFLRKLGYVDAAELASALKERQANTEELCRAQWPLILAVAEQLEARRRLSAAEL